MIHECRPSMFRYLMSYTYTHTHTHTQHTHTHTVNVAIEQLEEISPKSPLPHHQETATTYHLYQQQQQLLQQHSHSNPTTRDKHWPALQRGVCPSPTLSSAPSSTSAINKSQQLQQKQKKLHTSDASEGANDEDPSHNWSKVVRHGPTDRAGGVVTGGAVPVREHYDGGPKVQAVVGPPVAMTAAPGGVVGSSGKVFSPPQASQVEGHGHYLPANHPPRGALQQVRATLAYPRPGHPMSGPAEPPYGGGGTGMGFSPRLHSRPDVAGVGSVGMGIKPGIRSVPSLHDLAAYPHPPGPAYMNWPGYDHHRPRPYPPGVPGMPRPLPPPPMQGGYGMVRGFHAGGGGGGGGAGAEPGSGERMPRVVPPYQFPHSYSTGDIPRFHSMGEVGGAGGRRGPGGVAGGNGRLVLLRGLPGSGKTTLAR